MSDPVSPMKNAHHSAGIVEISEVVPTGMITLRGDMSTRKMQKLVKLTGGVDVPGQREIALTKTGGVAWMSPDELLIMCPYSEVSDAIATIQKSLNGSHALAVNVSDARAIFEVRGPYAREVMAKLAPVDVARGQFGPGQIRRTRLAQVAAAFWMPQEDVFHIVCFRSVAQYVFDLLKVAAQPGSEVDIF